MHDYGFIGYGSMARMLIKGLINSGKASQENIIVTRKNPDKLNEIKEDWPLATITSDVLELVKQSKFIFICVKPLDTIHILHEIKPVINPEHHIISIAGALLIQDIESIVNCKITKMLPTIISEVKEGITLICHSQKVSEAQASFIKKLLEGFTALKQVSEDDFGFASEFTSCGPGFYASIMQEFVDAGLRHSNCFTRDEISEMVNQTVYGTAKLLIENNMDYSDVITRVATKGGITEEGVKVLRSGLPKVYDEVLHQTMKKRTIVDNRLHDQFLG